MKIVDLFKEPKIIGIVGDVNEGKSMLLYNLIDNCKSYGKFNLFTYKLKVKVSNSTEIYSIEELEQIKNSVIILDEVMSLWDLEDRKAKRQIEKSLRLIHHNNNVLVVCGVPENFRKFIASKLDKIIFKKCSISDFVNGSRIKKIATNYKGDELGTSILNIPINQALVFDGMHYSKYNIAYLSKYDTKRKNVQILVKEKKQSKRPTFRGKNVEKGGENEKNN